MWVKVDDVLPEHRKVFAAGQQIGPHSTGRVLAVWLEAACYANKHATGGFLPVEVVQAFRHDPEPLTVAAAMAAARLWVACVGGWRIHDYHEYQPAAAPREDLHALRSAAGKRGAQVRWQNRWQTDGKPGAQNRWQNRWQTDGKPVLPSFCHSLDEVQSPDKIAKNGKPIASRWQKMPPDPDPEDQDQDQEQEPIAPSGAQSAGADPPAPTTAWLQATWNRSSPPLPKCLSLSASRRTHARVRLREHPARAYWLGVIGRLAETPFLLGHNPRGWKATFDWLLQPDSATRVLEGKYDHTNGQASKSAGNLANLTGWLEDPQP